MIPVQDLRSSLDRHRPPYSYSVLSRRRRASGRPYRLRASGSVLLDWFRWKGHARTVGRRLGAPATDAAHGVPRECGRRQGSSARVEDRGNHAARLDGQPTDEPVVFGWMPALSVFFRDPDGNLLVTSPCCPSRRNPGAGSFPGMPGNMRRLQTARPATIIRSMKAPAAPSSVTARSLRR